MAKPLHKKPPKSPIAEKCAEFIEELANNQHDAQETQDILTRMQGFLINHVDVVGDKNITRFMKTWPGYLISLEPGGPHKREEWRVEERFQKLKDAMAPIG